MVIIHSMQEHSFDFSSFLQRGRIGEELSIDFVVSTGDNFYEDGLRSINDPVFEKSFSKIYTAKSLQKQWYSGKSWNQKNC